MAVASPLTATFNEPVQASTISFTLTNSSGTAVAATASYNSSNDTVTLTPSAALAYGMTYTATISGALDTAGDPMGGSVTWSFTTDAASPTVTKESPASAATGVAVSSTVTATFNEAVQAGTITFALKTSAGTAVPATVAYNSSNFTVTLTPSSALGYGTTYTATLSGALDTVGDPMSGTVTWSFTTDPLQPAVTSHTPAAGATGVAVASPLTATFNEPVQASTISFTLTNSSGTAVAATASYNSSNDTVTLTPSAALAYGMTYTATISGALDTAGDPMGGSVTWSFTTDAASPTVTKESPASAATGVAVSSTVTATFNEAVQAGTITFALKTSAGTAVPATVAYNSSNFTVTLTPSSALGYGTTYTATLSGALDTVGDPMSGTVTWSFTTDPLQPAVTSHTPATGATGVAVASPLTATFNEPVQASTISFTLTNSSGTAVAATASYNSSNDTVTLTPSSALGYGTTYTATLRGALDMAGDPMSGTVTWSFTTAAPTPTSTSAIAVVPHGSVTYNTKDESSQTVTLPGGAAPGDLAVVLLTWNTSQSRRTSSPPTGWSTVAQNVTVQKGNTEGASVYYRVIEAGDSSWTFAMSGSVYLQVVLQTFSGINTSSPIDATGATSASSASDTVNANSVTVVHTGAWELIGIAQAQGDNATAHSFTGLSNYSYGATLLYDTTALNAGATGAVTVTGGGTASSNELAAIPFTIAPATSNAAAPTVMSSSGDVPVIASVTEHTAGNAMNGAVTGSLAPSAVNVLRAIGQVPAPIDTEAVDSLTPSAVVVAQNDGPQRMPTSLPAQSPLAALPDAFLDVLARDLLQLKQRKTLADSPDTPGQYGLGA